MKGISAVIATILMLMIIIALTGTAYLYISGIFGSKTRVLISLDSSSSCVGSALQVGIRNDGTDVANNVVVDLTYPDGTSMLKVCSISRINAGSSNRTSCALVGIHATSGAYYVRASSSGAVASGPVYCNVIRDSTLVGYWAFDEGRETTVSDSSGNGNTGTLNGATWVSGRYGNALSYDGITPSWVSIMSSSSFITFNQFSISAWVNYNPPYSGNDRYIVMEPSTAHMYLWVKAKNPLQATFGFWNGTAYNQVVTTGAIPINQWTSIVGTYNGTTVSIYVNGIYNNSVAAAGSGGGGPEFLIGNFGKNNLGIWSGLIDEVKIWNRSLSQSEITGLNS